jgi:hypothetical protein
MSYDALVITAHPDDAETQMGGSLAKLADRGQRILLVDLTQGEPSDFAPLASVPGRPPKLPASSGSNGSRSSTRTGFWPTTSSCGWRWRR